MAQHVERTPVVELLADAIEQHRMRAGTVVFRKRLPRMHRSGWAGKRASAAMVLAWFVFDRGHDGPPALDWIRA